MTFPVGLWSQSDSCLQLMRPPEASAQALKKVLSQRHRQLVGPVLAGQHPHGSMDGPVQPVPRCRCHLSFPRGYVELCQEGMCDHAMLSPCFWKCISVPPGAEHRDQGLAIAAAPFYLDQRLLLGTTLHWASQHQTLDAFAGTSTGSEKGLQKA